MNGNYRSIYCAYDSSFITVPADISVCKLKIKNIKDVYNTKVKLVNFSTEMKLFDKNIKLFLMSQKLKQT